MNDDRGVRRWSADLALGARMTVGGGRESWWRLALIAVGVAVGAAVLLVAAAAPAALTLSFDRDFDRYGTESGPIDPAALARPHVLQRNLNFTDAQAAFGLDDRLLLGGAEIAAVGSGGPVPPGIDRMPAAGEAWVSPALADLLADPHHDELRAVLPERVIGLIGPDGLTGPRDLWFWAGLSDTDRDLASPVIEYAPPAGSPELGAGPYVGDLAIVFAGAAAALVPVVVLILVVTRLGASSRERRFAALRLVGASPVQTRRIAATEALIGALAGLGLGAGLFLALRLLVGEIAIGGLELVVYPSDLVPDPLATLLLAVGVPIGAVVAALLGLRGVELGPLGVVRHTRPARRRLGWRVALIGTGVALLSAASVAEPVIDGPLSELLVVAIPVGVILLFAGATASVPWLVERTARLWRPSGVVGLLAVRRLQLDSGAVGRAVAGVTAVLTSGVLLLLLSALSIAGSENPELGEQIAAVPESSTMLDVTIGNPARSPVLLERLRQLDGVSAVHAERSRYAYSDAVGSFLVRSESCARLAIEYGVTECRPGQAFRPVYRPAPILGPTPGASVEFVDDTWSGSATERATAWTVPSYTDIDTGEPLGTPELLVVPSGADPVLEAFPVRYVAVTTDDAPRRLAAVAVTAATADRGSTAQVRGSDFAVVETGFDGFVFAVSLAVVLVAAANLLIGALYQVHERQRPLAALGALGVPQRTMAGAVLYETALAMTVGVAAAAATVLLILVPLSPLAFGSGVPPWASVPWTDVLTLLGLVAGVVVLVTACTLPALHRATRPDRLRFE